MFKDGLGMNVAWVAPFASYFWPGVILFVVVGGTHIVASIMLWRNSRWALEAAAKAGFGLLIWEFVELYIITKPHWLQGLYFGFGIITLVYVMVLLKYSTAEQEK